MGSSSAFKETIECPVCLRRAAPKLRTVASGVLTVCPYCLTPYLPAPRGYRSLRSEAAVLPEPERQRSTQAAGSAGRDDT